MKNKVYHTVGTVLKFNSKTVEIEAKSTTITYKSMIRHKSVRVKLVLCAQATLLNLIALIFQRTI